MLHDFLAIVGLVSIVSLCVWSIFKFFKKIIPAHKVKTEQELCRLHEVLEEAKKNSLEEAVKKLRDLGLYYDRSNYKGHFTFPRHFWEWGDLELKAVALLSLVNFYQRDCEFSVDQLGYYACQEDLTMTLARQAKKTPALVIALVGDLARLTDRERFKYLP